MPSEHPPRYTLSYLLRDRDGRFHLVDPGIDSDENHARLTSLLTEIGARTTDLASITVTHQHHDHLGMAARLRQETGASVALHRAEQEALSRLAGSASSHLRNQTNRVVAWGVPDAHRAELADVAAQMAERGAAPLFVADLLLDDGDELAVPGRRIRVLHTPGHTPGHICLVDADHRILFTGDHVLPTIFPGLGLGGPAADPIGDYLRSLDAVAPFDGHDVFPGHGYRFSGLAERVEVTRRHHLVRSTEIAAVLRERPDASIWQVAERVRWTAGWQNLRGFYLMSALSQTQMHVDHLAAAR
jgi:glyoxylase-like metal-dependent hydrolase (beta-lactamase superfamily II)